MKQQNDTPLYATLMYDVRKKLDVSWSEYVYLDMVQKLHIHQKWCTKSLESCAKDLGITRRAVINMKNRLIEKGLLRKSIKGYLQVTEKYTAVAVNKVHQTPYVGVNKVHKVVKKLHPASEETSPKNNNRITKNKEDDFRGKESQSKERIRKARLTGDWRLLKNA